MCGVPYKAPPDAIQRNTMACSSVDLKRTASSSPEKRKVQSRNTYVQTFNSSNQNQPCLSVVSHNTQCTHLRTAPNDACQWLICTVRKIEKEKKKNERTKHNKRTPSFTYHIVAHFIIFRRPTTGSVDGRRCPCSDSSCRRS